MVVNAGLGSPLVLLICVVIPLLPCLLLLHQRGHLGSPDVKRRLAFLFCSYRSVPAHPRLLCSVTCCMNYILSFLPLPGTFSQDSCWKCAHVMSVCACLQKHGCIAYIPVIMYAKCFLYSILGWQLLSYTQWYMSARACTMPFVRCHAWSDVNTSCGHNQSQSWSS